MNLDDRLYHIPLVGSSVKRLYAYFKRNTFITDLMHIGLGLGVGLIIAGGTFFIWGIVALAAGLLGHVYALVKGEGS